MTPKRYQKKLDDRKKMYYLHEARTLLIQLRDLIISNPCNIQGSFNASISPVRLAARQVQASGKFFIKIHYPLGYHAEVSYLHKQKIYNFYN